MAAEAPIHRLFIWNPTAGSSDRSAVARLIRSRCENGSAGDGRWADAFRETTHPGHARELAAGWAARYGEAGMVIACGGDGTAGEVAGGIAGSACAMGILPVGTANDFAKAMLTGTQPERILTLLDHPQIRPIDAIRVNGVICLNITSFGLDSVVQAKAMRLSDRCRWLGRMIYPIAIVASLFGRRRFTLRGELTVCDADGHTAQENWSGDFVLAAICNGRHYGGGFTPAPSARADDGQLVFSVVDVLPLRRILTLLPRYKKGRHIGDPAVHQWTVRGGRLRAPDGPVPGNIDGEPFDQRQVEFIVLPGVIRFAFC